MKYFTLPARCCAALLAILLVLELCARIDDRLSYGAPLWKPYNWQILEMEDGLGIRGRPSVRYQKWILNSLGYRGPDLRSGTVRIACFGASETFGIYEAPGEEFPRQLERELNSRFHSGAYEVVNVAMVGQRVGSAVRRIPQVVREIHPAYSLMYPSIQHYISIPLHEAPAVEVPITPGVDNSSQEFELRIAERMRNLAKQALHPSMQTRLRQLKILMAQRKQPVMDRVPAANLQMLRKHLRRFVAESKASGVEPLLITHATVFGDTVNKKDHDILVSWQAFYPMITEEGLLEMERQGNEVIRQVAAEDNVLMIDAARQIPPNPKYFAGDGIHFTTTGASVMASLIADFLQPVLFSRGAKHGSNSLATRTAPPQHEGL